MKKITSKQLEEIDFLENWTKPFHATTEERREYLNHSVHGLNCNPNNPLIRSKWKLDIMVQMWRKDLTIGLISVEDLKQDFEHPYFNKVIDSVIKSVTRQFRYETLSKETVATILSVTNFPEIKRLFMTWLGFTTTS